MCGLGSSSRLEVAGRRRTRLAEWKSRAVESHLQRAPWKNRRYRFKRRAIVRFPTSGSPRKMRTWRSPMFPASAPMGGGTATAGEAGRVGGTDSSESKGAASERARADRTRSKSEMTRRRDGARARTRRRRRVQLRRREEVLLRPDVHELRAEVGGDARMRDRQPRKEDACDVANRRRWRRQAAREEEKVPFVARADRTRAGAGRASASMDRRRSTESLAVGVSMTSSIIADAIAAAPREECVGEGARVFGVRSTSREERPRSRRVDATATDRSRLQQRRCHLSIITV